MHNVPTLSHGAPLTYNHRNKPTEQGIEPPQQQRHYQNNSHNDKRGLRGFLTSRPNDLADLRTRLFSQNKECLPLGSLQRYKGSTRTQNKQNKNAIDDRLSRKILITNHTNRDDSSHNDPLQNVEACFFGFSLGIHQLGPCEYLPNFLLGNLAGQEGIEPPTCGFGDRRSAN